MVNTMEARCVTQSHFFFGVVFAASFLFFSFQFYCDTIDI